MLETDGRSTGKRKELNAKVLLVKAAEQYIPHDFLVVSVVALYQYNTA